MENIHLPQKWYIARIKFLESELKSTPDARIGKHGNGKVIWLWQNSQKTEIRQNSNRFNEYEAFALKRMRIKNELTQLKKEWNCYFKENLKTELSRYTVVPNSDNRMTHSFWTRLVDQECPEPKKNIYKVDDHNLRSRFEMMIAEAAKSLRLVYKYECGIRANNDSTFFVDFVFDFEEFNRCLAYEAFGMMDSEVYQAKTNHKIASFWNTEILMGRDLFAIYSDNKYVPDIERIKQHLVYMVDTLCEEYVREID